MSPRNKIWSRILSHLAIFLFFLALSPPVLFARDDNTQFSFISFFQEHISAVDGNRCPMFPSCSTYAANAVKKHGPVMGWIMTCDRLVRCGRDETTKSPMIRTKKGGYTYDPVEANDSWWFKEE